MNIWVTYSRRKSHCASECGLPIKAGDPIVVAKHFKEVSDTKRITLYFYKHFDCWVKDAQMYLQQNPFVAAGNHTGRPKTMNLSEEDKATRLKLLQRKACLDQQLRKKLKIAEPELKDLESIARIQSQLAGVTLEIAQVGGIPTSWIEDMLN